MKCEVCQKKTKEELIYEVSSHKVFMMDMMNVKKKPLCHEHLIAEFAKRLAEFPHKLVIFYPDLDASKKNFAYAFLPLDKLHAFGKDLATIDKGVSDIDGALCMRCGQPAQVAYFGRHALPRDDKGDAKVIKWNKPFGEQVQAKPEIICLKCAGEAILPALRLYDKFNSGICAPYLGVGVLVTLVV